MATILKNRERKAYICNRLTNWDEIRYGGAYLCTLRTYGQLEFRTFKNWTWRTVAIFKKCKSAISGQWFDILSQNLAQWCTEVVWVWFPTTSNACTSCSIMHLASEAITQTKTAAATLILQCHQPDCFRAHRCSSQNWSQLAGQVIAAQLRDPDTVNLTSKY